MSRRRLFRRIEVKGESMRPLLEPGDRVIAVGLGRPRPGDLVACADPRDPARVMVKRVTGRDPAGGYIVHGDNADHSTDSRHFGPIEPKLIMGRLLYRYLPAPRSGLIWRRDAR